MIARSRKSLGILVTSADHTASVHQLIKSARSKGVSVWVCLIGPAAADVGIDVLNALAAQARLAICRNSEEPGEPSGGFSSPKYTNLQISSAQLLDHLSRCDRWVIF